MRSLSLFVVVLVLFAASLAGACDGQIVQRVVAQQSCGCNQAIAQPAECGTPNYPAQVVQQIVAQPVVYAAPVVQRIQVQQQAVYAQPVVQQQVYAQPIVQRVQVQRVQQIQQVKVRQQRQRIVQPTKTKTVQKVIQR